MSREETKQNEILEIRACLGRWQNNTTSIEITLRDIDAAMDSRIYRVSEARNFRPPMASNFRPQEVKAKIKTLQQMGYKLIAPQFPELQQFFRNGKPITEKDIFEDAIDTMKTETVDNRTGLEFLFDTY